MILEHYGAQFLEYSKPLCELIAKYSCRNQMALVKAASELGPTFEKISSQFFMFLYQTIEIVESTNSKKYDKIVEIVVQDETLSVEEKINLVVKNINTLKEESHRRRIETIKTLGGESIKIAATIGGFIIASIVADDTKDVLEKAIDYKAIKNTNDTKYKIQQSKNDTKVKIKTSKR